MLLAAVGGCSGIHFGWVKGGCKPQATSPKRRRAQPFNSFHLFIYNSLLASNNSSSSFWVGPRKQRRDKLSRVRAVGHLLWLVSCSLSSFHSTNERREELRNKPTKQRSPSKEAKRRVSGWRGAAGSPN